MSGFASIGGDEPFESEFDLTVDDGGPAMARLERPATTEPSPVRLDADGTQPEGAPLPG